MAAGSGLRRQRRRGLCWRMRLPITAADADAHSCLHPNLQTRRARAPKTGAGCCGRRATCRSRSHRPCASGRTTRRHAAVHRQRQCSVRCAAASLLQPSLSCPSPPPSLLGRWAARRSGSLRRTRAPTGRCCGAGRRRGPRQRAAQSTAQRQAPARRWRRRRPAHPWRRRRQKTQAGLSSGRRPGLWRRVRAAELAGRGLWVNEGASQTARLLPPAAVASPPCCSAACRQPQAPNTNPLSPQVGHRGRVAALGAAGGAAARPVQVGHQRQPAGVGAELGG